MGRGQVLSIYRTLIPVCVLFFISVRELTFFLSLCLFASFFLFAWLSWVCRLSVCLGDTRTLWGCMGWDRLH